MSMAVIVTAIVTVIATAIRHCTPASLPQSQPNSNIMSQLKDDDDKVQMKRLCAIRVMPSTAVCDSRHGNVRSDDARQWDEYRTCMGTLLLPTYQGTTCLGCISSIIHNTPLLSVLRVPLDRILSRAGFYEDLIHHT